MKSLYYNYVAMGEAVMEWVVNTYLNAMQRINYFGQFNEASKDAWNTIEAIDVKVYDEHVYHYLPHVAFDNALFLYELREFADKYKEELNPIPADSYVQRKVWEKLPVTADRKTELEDETAFQSAKFIQNMCDEKLLMMCATAEYDIREYFDERLAALSEDERNILIYRFGLNGKPCMSYKEIGYLYDQYTVFDVMKIERDALLKLF